MRKLNIILLFLIGFFAPLGEGTNFVVANISLVYPSLCAVISLLNIGKLLPNSKLHPHYTHIYNVIVQNRTYNLINMGVGSLKAFAWLYLYVILNTVLHYIFANETINYFLFVRFLLFIFSTSLFSRLFTDDRMLDHFVVGYMLGFVLSMLTGLNTKQYGDVMRMTGGFGDPNAFAFEALSVLLLALHFASNRTRRGRRWFYISIAVLAALAVVLSFSRGAMLALALCAVLFLLQKEGRRRLPAVLVMVAVMFGVVIFVASRSGIELRDIYSDRMTVEAMTENGGANRTYIWTLYLQRFNHWIVWGEGLGQGSNAIAGFNSFAFDYETHNQYLLYFVDFGFIGGLLYLIHCCFMFRVYRRTKGIGIFMALLPVMMLVVTIFLNTHHGRTYWIVVAIANSLWLRYRTRPKPSS